MKSVSAAAALLITCLAAHSQTEPLKVKQPPPTRTLAAPISADGGGRFVFGQINDVRADQYLLDTKTGRVWHLSVDKDGNEFFKPVQFDMDVPGEDFRPRP